MKKFLSLMLAIVMVLSLGLVSASAEEGLTGEFTVLHFNNEADTSGTSYGFWQAAKAFEAANPGVTIHYEFVAHDDYEAYINTLMAGSSLPDVFLIKGDLVSTMADGDLIYAEEPMIQQDADWYGQYVGGAFDDGSYNGVGYTVPFQMQANCVVVYNQKIFDECGVEKFPETYAELVEDLPKFIEKGYTPIGLGNGGQWLAPSCLLNTFCYRYVDGEWFESLRSDSGAKWTDEAIVKALTDFQALATAGAFNADMNSIDQDGMYQLYYNQKCAMMINGAWMVGEVMSNCPADVAADTHVALMPGDSGNKNVAAGAGWGWTVNKSVSEENLPAVQAFLKAITTGDYADKALGMGFFSAANTTSVDESALNPLFKEYWDIEKTMNFLPIWDVVLPASFGSGEYYASTQELLIGAITPEEMAQRLQDAWEMAK